MKRLIASVIAFFFVGGSVAYYAARRGWTCEPSVEHRAAVERIREAQMGVNSRVQADTINQCEK
jgi:hypothetical protein